MLFLLIISLFKRFGLCDLNFTMFYFIPLQIPRIKPEIVNGGYGIKNPLIQHTPLSRLPLQDLGKSRRFSDMLRLKRRQNNVDAIRYKGINRNS